MRDKFIIAFLIAVVLAIGVIAGFFLNLGLASIQKLPPSSSVRADLKQYKFIKPFLFTDNAKSTDRSMRQLQSAIADYISGVRKDDGLLSISVYFRDLNAGMWTGVGEDQTYSPSSMLKVVAMMAALKVAESDPAVISQKLYLKRSPESQALYVPDYTSESGYYSLQELINMMITHSDNDALNAIVSDPAIKNEFGEVYTLLRLPTQNPAGDQTDFISPRSFSAIFRSLYNSSFYQWSLSEQILSLLSKTTFKDGLVAGVPAGTAVAHKFGENTNELHDCGIVYYPGRPYLLCIMTKGDNLKKLEGAIAGISSLTYAFVDGEERSAPSAAK